MANFSLLTTLSLNAAGFTKGLDKVSKQTQSFKKGTEQASKSIASSFTNLSGVLGGAVNTQLGTLGQSITSGISAFKAMIPAINGVKMALISSGIGAIVVAIGVAFAAIMSYLTGTAEGAKKLNVILGYLKGTFNALLSRVNAFGSGLVSLLSGDFEGFKKSMQDAFKGGLMDEIKADAKEFVSFAEEENRIRDANRDLLVEESELNAQIANFQTDAKNKSLTKEQRQKAYNELLKKDEELDKKKLQNLDDQVALQEKINASKGNNVSTQDLDKLADLKKARNDFLAQDAQEQAGYNRIGYQIGNVDESTKSYTETLEDNIKSLKEQQKELIATGKDFADVTRQIAQYQAQLDKINETAEQANKGITKASPIKTTDTFKVPDDPIPTMMARDKQVVTAFTDEFENALTKLGGSLQEFFTKFGEGINKGFNVAFQSLALWDSILELQEQQELERAGDNAAMKEEVEKKYAKKRKKMLMAQAIAQGAVAVIGALTTQPIWVGLVMAALTAAMVGVQIAKINSAGFAQGGIVAGTSFVGDKVTANVNSGEMILNGRQQAQLFKLANKGGVGGGEVVFRVEGTQLVGVLSNYSKQTQRTR